MGVAINSEEYVPMTIPTSNAKENPFNTSPPNKKRIRTTINVVAEVISVLLRVLLNASLNTSYTADPDLILKFSLILSNTTTVSLIEYPITVRIEATNT